MRKYRIMETPNAFYPQEKRWYGWVYIDNLRGDLTWFKDYADQSKCESFDYAKRCIERRKEWLIKGNTKPIYHKIQ